MPGAAIFVVEVLFDRFGDVLFGRVELNGLFHTFDCKLSHSKFEKKEIAVNSIRQETVRTTWNLLLRHIGSLYFDLTFHRFAGARFQRYRVAVQRLVVAERQMRRVVQIRIVRVQVVHHRV